MILYKNKELFKQLVIDVAKEKGIAEAIVEKDYYVSLILQEINKYCDKLVFKGGTSLSKCYSIINRFSEDIDLSCCSELTQGERSNIIHTIISIIEKLGFSVVNREQIKSRMDFNHFEIKYPILFNNNDLKNYVIIDLYFSITAYPIEKKLASNYIYEYLLNKKLLKVVNFDELKPFQIITQSIDRTFVDKVFAICDFYLSQELKENSRYIYDLYKIINSVSLNNNLKEMIVKVRKDRQTSRRYISAQENYDINVLLKEIIDKEVFRNDYEDNTLKIIFDDVSYDIAISSLQRIIDKKIF